GIEEQRAVQADATPLGAKQSGNGVDDARLTGAGGAEEGGHRGRARKLRIERKVSELLRDGDLKHPQPPIRAAMRRESNSDATSAASEIRMATITSRIVLASPPGTCV